MATLNIEECELLGDSKYRAYISQVEKALRSFENTSEWADLISALGKLNKVLTHHVRYPIIPKRVTIGKRLAQCLHPVLPSGVHLKVLETYDIIFKCIGTQRLAGDLFTYSAGLFPLLAYSAMNVKPALLSLFENHFVPLGRHIRPAMTGILQGLLPGLEDASEHHDRTNNLLEEFCEATNSTYFYGCLWDIVLANPNIRLSAINFVLAHFNRKQTMEDQLHLMGTNIDTMVEALCISVQDSSVLVQRSALDLVLVGFPVHNSQLTRQDMIKVATAVIKVLLRRDMSLNRRLYAWILGTDASGAPLHLANQPDLRVPATIERLDSFSSTHEYTASYFNVYSKELLVHAVKDCIKEGRRGNDVMSPGLECGSGKAANLRPFKILMSLLDKPEIGPVILEDMLIDIFRYTYKECVGRAAWEDAVDGECGKPQVSPDWPQDALHKALQQKCVQKAAQSEVIKMANLLFGAFEPYFMWDFIGRAFEKICAQELGERLDAEEEEDEEEAEDVTFTELTVLVNFLLDKVPLETFLETQTEHLPELLREIMGSLQQHCDKMTDRELVRGLKLCSKVLTKVQPSVTPAGGFSSGDTSGPDSPVRHVTMSPTSPVRMWRRKTESESDLSQPGLTLRERLRCQSESNMCRIINGEDSSDSGVEEPGADQRENKIHLRDDKKQGGMEGEDLEKDEDEQMEEGGKKMEDGKKDDGGDKKEKHEEQRENGEKSEEDGDMMEEQKEMDQSSGDAPVTNAVMMPSEESFSDFVQYEVSQQPSDGLRLPRKQVPRTLMQACVETFQSLFHTILVTHIVKDTQLSDCVLDQLCKQSVADSPLSTDGYVIAQIPLENLSNDVSEAFDSACQLLVDFSSFPMYCVDQMRVIRSSTFKEEYVTFPDWLKLLITCSCFLDNFAIQTTAISTMLDLIGLTLSTMDEHWSSGQDVTDAIFHAHHRAASVGQTVSVVIVPSVTQTYLSYIDNKTNFYKIVAGRLWHYLGEETIYGHQRCVDLIYQLHQIAPTRWHCEDVIGNALLSENKNEKIAAHKKFSILWNLLRDKTTLVGTPRKNIRSFDRSMFVMLDSLQVDTHPCHVVTQTWLNHALQRGDIARLLEPLLLILLHPDTARISIQHVNIHQPKRLRLSVDSVNDAIDSAEAKIYAISSEGGNVMYHMSSDGCYPAISKHPDKQHTFALTSVTDGRLATHTARTLTDMEFHFDKVNPQDLNVRVNPFIAGESPIDRVSVGGCTPPSPGMLKDIHNARRLDAEMCRKEGIFFDEEDEGGEDEIDNAVEATEATAETAQEIVDDILQEVIDAVFETRGDVENDTESTYDDSSSISSRTSVTIDQTDDAMDDIKESLLGVQSKDYNNSVIVDDLFSGGDTPDDVDTQSATESEPWPSQIHPLHTHILLYSQKYDAHRTLYALSTFKSMLAASPKLICAMATTSVCNMHSQHLEELHKLLIRHRRSVFGKNFFGEIANDASLSSYHSNMYVEILISICLYFVRSYYPNLMRSKLTSAELEANKQVQILSCEVLTLLLSELASLTRNSGKGFATYIGDLLVRCKVQKALLHCLLASVHNARQKGNHVSGHSHFTDVIVSFNEDNADTSEVFQVHLLKLVRVVIILEEQIRRAKSDAEHPIAFPLPMGWEKVRVNFQPSLTSVQYQPAMPVICQGMLLSAILSALRQQHLCYVHQHWITMVTSVMPYMGRALSVVVTTVVGQLCHNIEQLAQQYEAAESRITSTGRLEQIPPDHVINLLEEMTSLCHYCLLDSGQQEVSLGQSLAAVTNNLVNDTATNLLTNLLHVFTPSAGSREPSPVKEIAGTISPVVEARKRMLSFLPRIISSLAHLWKVVGYSESRCSSTDRKDSCWRMGSPKTVKLYILEFLSPISRHHPVNLLAAIAVIWNDWRKRGSVNVKKVVSVAGDDQLLLVELVSAIKVLPMDTLIQTIKQVIKQPPLTIQDTKRKPPLGISMLQFCFAHIQHSPGSQLLHSWPAMLTLLKDALQLAISPPAQFLLLAILNEFVQKIPMFEDRKDQKDLQEIAQKFLEACSEIAGASLEVTTWLSRNLAVKPGPQIEVTAEVDEVANDQGPDCGFNTDTLPTTQPITAAQDVKRMSQDWNYQQYSVQALVMLADITAPLLDVVYRSEEKDKVVPFLSTIMHNVFPYLRNHRSHNLPSFRTCSQMLASLSGYQYTRKAWKKEVFDLLLDPTYFQMDEVCIGYWRIVIDNLMTHDRTTFRDLLARVIVTPGASLNLFSSREQEFEQRALLLKRLNFTIFCSDVDQYHKFMPDIQERTSESLKAPTVPGVQAQVFMAFRVLMLRMSPHHLTSLWPTIITELVHVLLQIEQELCPDLEEMTRTQLSRLANLDPSWALGNGLNTNKNPSWLKLYLAACKLLDLALVLPTNALPQFQLYRWAFLGDPGSEVDEKGRLRDQQPRFTPHVFRIAKLMNKRFGEVAVTLRRPGQLLLTTVHICCVQDLHSFFVTLAAMAQSADSFTDGCTPAPSGSRLQPLDQSAIAKSQSTPDFRCFNEFGYGWLHRSGTRNGSSPHKQYIESVIECDFLEPLPRD